MRQPAKMPKGALLHVHLDLTVNGTTLLALALQHPSIHIRASAQITPASMKSVTVEFRPLPPNFVHQYTSLCLPTYKPGEWVPLRSARDLFDAALGGTQGFDRWIANCLTINPSDAYVTHNDNIRVRKIVSIRLKACIHSLKDMGQVPCSWDTHKCKH